MIVTEWSTNFPVMPCTGLLLRPDGALNNSVNVDGSEFYSLLARTCDSSSNQLASKVDVSSDSLVEEECRLVEDVLVADSSDVDASGTSDHVDQTASRTVAASKRLCKKDMAQERRRPSYSCNRCSRIYSKKHSVLRHLRYECGVEPRFQCTICNQRFKHRSDQQRHQRKIHGVDTLYDDDMAETNGDFELEVISATSAGSGPIAL